MHVWIYVCMHYVQNVSIYGCCGSGMHVCMYIWIYVCMNMCEMWVYMGAAEAVCMCVCMYVYLTLWGGLCCRCGMYVCMYVCEYVYMYQSEGIHRM